MRKCYFPLFVLVLLSVGFSQTVYVDREKIDLIRAQGKKGKRIYMTGSILAISGLTVNVSGDLIYAATGEKSMAVASAAGGVALSAGIPIMGIGSSISRRAAEKLSPTEFGDPSSGWIVYFTSLGLRIGSVAILALEATTKDTLEIQDVIIPWLLSTTSSTLHFLSWYRFSKVKEEAEIHIALQPWDLNDRDRTINPMLRISYVHPF